MFEVKYRELNSGFRGPADPFWSTAGWHRVLGASNDHSHRVAARIFGGSRQVDTNSEMGSLIGFRKIERVFRLQSGESTSVCIRVEHQLHAFDPKWLVMLVALQTSRICGSFQNDRKGLAILEAIEHRDSAGSSLEERFL